MNRGVNKKSNDMQDVAHTILKLVKTHAEMEKRVRSYGTDVQIHKSEINMIARIAENPGIHIGGLAEILDITKGSVSEIVNKLVKKGLVAKKVDEYNLSKLALELTDKGLLAHSTFMCHQAEINCIVEDTLKASSDDEISFLLRFLSSLNAKLNGKENTSLQ